MLMTPGLRADSFRTSRPHNIAMGISKFDSFDRLDLAFASVNGHKLEATILTPEKLQEKASGIYPVLVYWHGGGFIVGHRMYEPWWSNWQVASTTAFTVYEHRTKS
jgi:acetyl esterase/lipase